MTRSLRSAPLCPPTPTSCSRFARSRFTRRQWLTSAGLGSLASALPGCGPHHPHPVAVRLRGGVAIDAHCHVFNAADLPVSTFLLGARSPIKGYLSRHPLLARSANLIADSITKLLIAAPDEQAEQRFLNGESQRDPLDLWDASVSGFVKDLLAVEMPRGVRAWTNEFPPELEPERQILGAALRQDLDLDTRSQFATMQLTGLASKFPGSVFALLDLLLSWCRQLSDYRIRNIDRLLEMYGQERLGVGILVPALVDFHRWLPDPRDPILSAHPQVTLDKQVPLMAKIIALRPGVHPMVPFDPRHAWEQSRDLLDQCFNRDGHGKQGNGFAGVKLYPPLGYSPWDNSHLKSISPELQALVETNFKNLYDYCQKFDVPLMAHCNASNGTQTADLGKTYLAKQWRRVIELYPKLRINLAHFGGVADFASNFASSKPTPEQDEIGSLMKLGNVFTDIADENLIADEAFRKKVSPALKDFFERNQLALERMMYGSDWIMLGIESLPDSYLPAYPNYLGGWYSELRALLDDQQQERLFGGNALDFLGVTRDGLSRRRLENFYQDIGQEPLWFGTPLSDAGTGAVKEDQ